ncbi:MAG: DUF4446 family protein [Patescibacteria group bacterium]
MVFSDGFIITLVVILYCVLGVVVFSIWKIRTHYDRLTKGVADATLTSILTGLLGEVKSLEKRVRLIELAIEEIHTEGMHHVKRVGIVRFNPFSDTGGAQSFTIAILDGHKSGIVMTSLYARMGNRWYVKAVVKGQGKDMELSKEELSAIKQAIGDK